MNPERPSRGDARHPRIRPEVTLQPPPRPGAEVVRSPGRMPSSGRGPRAAGAAALLAVLAAAGAGVFVLLPRWMASRPRPSVAVPQPSEQAVPALSPAPVTSPAAPSVAAAPEAADEPEAADSRPAARPAAPQGIVTAPPRAEDPEWAGAMSEGLAALDRGQFAEAQSALARAEAARPGTSVVADARKRAEEGLKAEALSGHRARAESAEAREDFRAALAEYDAALKLEPQVAFAVEGRARSHPRAELDQALASYLQRPERLSAEAVAREAETALDRARDVEPAGPRLQQQRTALERILREARTPVNVRLLSDGLTEVAVLRVGTLGTFRERKLALRPGSYVVLGKRQGYRDTRKTLVVSATRIPPPLDVRCDQTL